jgi:predicted dehydrogenase
MIKAGEFDLLSIVTPPYLHYEIALAAFEAGIHVLCEKPMALNMQEARKMLGWARKVGLTAMIDHEFRYLRVRKRFGDLVRDGYIGGLRHLGVQFQMDWWANPERQWSWWNSEVLGGGSLRAIGSHYFDAIQLWFRRPIRVWGKLSTFIPVKETNLVGMVEIPQT